MLMMLALVRTVVETLPADARPPGSKKLSQLMLMILALAGQFVEKALAADAHDARSRWLVVETLPADAHNALAS